MKPYWVRAAEYAGLHPDRAQVELMDRYRSWLGSEGVTSGGIGPAETERVDRRHLADSLLFASQVDLRTPRIWDFGSGVGLPGIPLAICLPGIEIILVDRSGRRADLLRRVIRVLGLENCQVEQADITELDREMETIVSRASLPATELGAVVKRCLGREGVAVAAGSWQRRPHVPGWSTVEIPGHVLDQTVWLLIMRPQ